MNGAMAAPWFDWTKDASRLETLCADAPAGKSKPPIRISASKKMEARWSMEFPGYEMRITRREVYHGNALRPGLPPGLACRLRLHFERAGAVADFVDLHAGLLQDRQQQIRHRRVLRVRQ